MIYTNRTMETTKKPFYKKKDDQINFNVYSRCLLTRQIVLPMVSIGKNLKETIETNIKFNFEGKCSVEGYIKENSTKIIAYSSGMIENGSYISFEVVFECEICFPVEGMKVSCFVKNVTRAGIRAESDLEVPSPIVVFVAKDHHFESKHFNEVKEGDKIIVRVIGQRFELNDKYISIIGELTVPKEIRQPSKPRIVIDPT